MREPLHCEGKVLRSGPVGAPGPTAALEIGGRAVALGAHQRWPLHFRVWELLAECRGGFHGTLGAAAEARRSRVSRGFPHGWYVLVPAKKVVSPAGKWCREAQCGRWNGSRARCEGFPGFVPVRGRGRMDLSDLGLLICKMGQRRPSPRGRSQCQCDCFPRGGGWGVE